MSQCCSSHEEHDCCGKEDCGGECQCGGGSDCHCGGEGPCHGHHFQRQFQTKAEQIVELEAYLSELQKEVQAVEERLADLKK